MKKPRRFLLSLLLLTLLAALCAPPAWANSGPPPGITVAVAMPPEDMTISLYYETGEGTYTDPFDQIRKGWEIHYHLYYHDLSGMRDSVRGAALVVERPGQEPVSYELPENALQRYGNFWTLDLGSGELSFDAPAWREPLMVALRVIVTLLLEGAVFYAFGCRDKKLWRVFLIVNLITQGALNLMITGPFLSDSWFMFFLFAEAVIFAVEMLVFSMVKWEGRTAAHGVKCAFVANFVSLVAGGVIIACLPV